MRAHLLLFLLLFLLASATVSAAPEPSATSRFSGAAGLIAAPVQSADQRFQLRAEFQATQSQPSGHFALNARLQPDAKSGATQCGPPSDPLFADGFEN